MYCRDIYGVHDILWCITYLHGSLPHDWWPQRFVLPYIWPLWWKIEGWLATSIHISRHGTTDFSLRIEISLMMEPRRKTISVSTTILDVWFLFLMCWYLLTTTTRHTKLNSRGRNSEFGGPAGKCSKFTWCTNFFYAGPPISDHQIQIRMACSGCRKLPADRALSPKMLTVWAVPAWVEWISVLARIRTPAWFSLIWVGIGDAAYFDAWY